MKSSAGQFTKFLNQSAECIGEGKKICVIIDGLDKIQDKRKAGKVSCDILWVSNFSETLSAQAGAYPDFLALHLIKSIIPFVEMLLIAACLPILDW